MAVTVQDQVGAVAGQQGAQGVLVLQRLALGHRARHGRVMDQQHAEGVAIGRIAQQGVQALQLRLRPVGRWPDAERWARPSTG